MVTQKDLEGPCCFREWVADPDGATMSQGNSLKFMELGKDG